MLDSVGDVKETFDTANDFSLLGRRWNRDKHRPNVVEIEIGTSKIDFCIADVSFACPGVKRLGSGHAQAPTLPWLENRSSGVELNSDNTAVCSYCGERLPAYKNEADLVTFSLHYPPEKKPRPRPLRSDRKK